MKILYHIILSTLVSVPMILQAQTPEVWQPDCGDGTYTNPIIHADYSDPDVCAVGDDFYLTASSFACTPGLPILHSRDMVNWQIVNYALPALKPADFYDAAPRHGKGVWAPCIKYHNGEYFIFWGDPDYGIFMVKTTDPRGRWSEPVLVKVGKGMIDPTPLWDADGKAYLAHAWAASRSRFNSVITLWEMEPDGTALIGTPTMIYDGNDGVNHTVEGPKLYHIGDYYYIFAPAGGVATGWQLVLRSPNIYGPYESRIVMAQGNTDINGPHQGALVNTRAGEYWFVHFQDKGLYGRVVHLNPVQWVDWWPVIGTDADGDGCGEPVSRYRKPVVEPVVVVEVHGGRFDLFQWTGNYQPQFGFPASNGTMRIYSHNLSPEFVNMWEVPNMYLHKFPAEKFIFTSKVRVSTKSTDAGSLSGLIVMGYDYSALALQKQGEKYALLQVECTDAEHGGAQTETVVAMLDPTREYAAGLHPNSEITLYLRVSVTAGGSCTFSYSTDCKRFKTVGKTFTAKEGKWIGAKVGFFSTAPYAADRAWIDILDFKFDKIKK